MDTTVRILNCVWCGKGHKNVKYNTYTLTYNNEKQAAFVCPSCRTLTKARCKKCDSVLWSSILSNHPEYCISCLEKETITCHICNKEIEDKDSGYINSVCDIGSEIVVVHKECLFDDDDDAVIPGGGGYSHYFKQDVVPCRRCSLLTVGAGQHTGVHPLRYDFAETPRLVEYSLCTVCNEYTDYDALADCWALKENLQVIDTISHVDRSIAMVIRTVKSNLLLPKESAYLVCSRCGENVSFLFRDYVCLACKKQGQTKIHQYSHRPLPVFFDVPEDKESHNNLFFGVENEFSFSTDGSDTKENRITSLAYSKFWYFKSDSSICNGYECVTHPASLRYWQRHASMEFAEMFQKLSVRKHSSCGLHIHMPKNAFTNAHLFKFGFFITKEIDFFSRVAGRRPNYYCNLDGTATLIKKAKDKKGNTDRYRTVNTLNDNTVEVRLFSGKTTFSAILHDVECLAALYYFTKQAKISEINQKNFIQYVLNNKDTYSTLVKNSNIS